jgi:catechol 2,3-dioxygenase-like lactoylglutathione lyase family enzyme
MFTVGKLFHLAHLVEDLDAVDRWYDDVFDCDRFYRRYEKAAMRDASLLVISDMIMEPIQPSSAPEAAGSPLAKFKGRYGNRLHSIAWYVDDITECAAHFLKLGIRQVGLTGRPVTDPSKAVAVWTHPKDTHALLEFCEPTFAVDPRLQEGWTDTRWSTQHPLRIQRTSHITVLLEDLDNAEAVYGTALQGRLLHRDDQSAGGPRAYYAVGEETVIDAVQPTTTDTPEGRDFADNGEGVHAIVFATADLNSATAFLRERNQRLEPAGDDTVFINQEDSFGLRVGFTRATIPGDTRG